MPTIVILGFTGYSQECKAEAVYVGNNGDDAAKATAAVKPGRFVRGLKVVNPLGVPVSFPRELSAEEKKIAAEAQDRRDKSAKKRAEAEAEARAKAAKVAETHAERAAAEKKQLAKAKAEKDAADRKADEDLRLARKAENDAMRARLKAEAKSK